MAALTLVATQVSASSMATPDVESMVEVASNRSPTSTEWIVPMLAAGAIAVIVINSGGSQTPTQC